MKKRAAALLTAALLAGAAAASEEIRFFGKSVMFSANTITSNLLQSNEHRVLIKALRSVGLEQPLLHGGLYTLFAPDDAAFAKLPADYSESIFRRVNRGEIAKLLACHIVAEGELAGRKLLDRLKSGGPADAQDAGRLHASPRVQERHGHISGRHPAIKAKSSRPIFCRATE